MNNYIITEDQLNKLLELTVNSFKLAENLSHEAGCMERTRDDIAPIRHEAQELYWTIKGLNK